MSHQRYVTERQQREPRFGAERQVAAAEFFLGETLARRRHELNVSLAQLAATTGITEERLEEIEAGDSLTLHEVLWLLHALEVSVIIGPDFEVVPRVAMIAAEPRVQ
jgi:transcriptional regulator with XRE-family HTH domain